MKSKNFQFLLYSIAFTSIAVAMHQASFKNFLLDGLSLSSQQYGWVDGIKEIPGLVAVGLIGFTARFTERNVWVFSSFVIAAALITYSIANDFISAAVYTLIFSVGTHLWSILGDYLVTDFSTPQNRSIKFGQIAAYRAGASLIGMGVVWLLSFTFSFDAVFIIGGFFSLIGLVMAARITKNKRPHGPSMKLVFRGKYFPYYLLSLLSAAREMVFITFAALLLIQIYDTSLQSMAILTAIHGALAVITRPLIGKITQKLGDLKALAVNYGLVTAVFLGYAYIDHQWVVYLLFVIDDVLAGFDDIAISSYAGRLVPKHELSSTLAMGSTLSHMVAVCIPIAGTFIWVPFGSVYPFLFGAVITVLATLFALLYAKRG
ncbi:MFS transporter [Paenactinomyces guangxiensis]|uniref:MFS transporter n=1 Tax=Paenactinomyces guangxiensis TaxID=1490290 RepID=A0A7W1WSH9_9BACL|nr:MFS transporter [Paenactinomyces guangxiensis]MBA4495026.1 MFS transporter [Paenactinomyces guangxiensis]MBH8592109.1 MFS transporter [Paenactinomyces guangxiensis]